MDPAALVVIRSAILLAGVYLAATNRLPQTITLQQPTWTTTLVSGGYLGTAPLELQVMIMVEGE